MDALFAFGIYDPVALLVASDVAFVRGGSEKISHPDSSGKFINGQLDCVLSRLKDR